MLIKFIGKKELSILQQILLSVCTCGLYYIICKVSKQMTLWCKYTNSTLYNATHILILDQYSNAELYKISEITPNDAEYEQFLNSIILKRFFDKKSNAIKILDIPYGRFIFDLKLLQFVTLEYPMKIIKQMTQLEKSVIFGSNTTEIKIDSLVDIITKNFFNSEFLWELFTMYIWMSLNFWYYFYFAGTLYFIFFLKNIYDDYIIANKLDKQQKENSKIMAYKKRYKDNSKFEFVQTNHKNIYPGDIILIEVDNKLNCDLEIINGDVIVDESFLTGESIPIYKGKGEIIYAGTKVIRSLQVKSDNIFKTESLNKLVRLKNLFHHTKKYIQNTVLFKNNLEVSTTNKYIEKAEGIVLTTGKKTRKNQLINSILIQPKFLNVFKKTIVTIVLISLICISLISSIVMFYLKNYVSYKIAVAYSIDLIIAVFSPNLIKITEFGLLKSVSELKKLGITCNDKNCIMVAGNVDLCIFDKTGTLTETELEVQYIDLILFRVTTFDELASHHLLRLCMATCHNIVELDGEYNGDILDMKMFLFSKSVIYYNKKQRIVKMLPSNCMDETLVKIKEYKENNTYPNKENDNYDLFISKKEDMCKITFNQSYEFKLDEYAIVQIYEFNSILKYMSVVVRSKTTGKYFVFCKGAAEILRDKLKSIPEEYMNKNHDFGIKGHRVIVMCYKEIDSFDSNMQRESIEYDLVFLGFLVLANNLKKETQEVITALNQANIKSKMCTGDSILTAISVARESHMVSFDQPIIFPTIIKDKFPDMKEPKKFFDDKQSTFDIEWICVGEDEYFFDKTKFKLYSEFNNYNEIDFAIAIEMNEYIELMKIDYYKKLILEKGVVFARFTPDLKKNLVEQYTSHTTLFCGDGANDIGALSSANIGLLLSSNTNGGFTSFSSLHLKAIISLINEGKGSLAVGISQFKFVLYSQILTGIQMLALILRQHFPSDSCSLIIDLISCYGLGNALIFFNNPHRLTKQRPQINLYTQVIYMIMELLLILGVLCAGTLYFLTPNMVLRKLSECQNPSENHIIENGNLASVTFFIIIWLIILKAFYFANYGEFKESKYSNKNFIIAIVCLSISLVIIFGLNITKNSIVCRYLDITSLTPYEILVFCGMLAATTGITMFFNYSVNNIDTTI